MGEKAIPVIPISEGEKLLRQKFYEQIAAQSSAMDSLGERLLTLELAIPGLYAAVLKLVEGDKGVVALNAAFYIAFTCWLLALLLTLAAITPRKYEVEPTVLKQDPAKMKSEGMGIEDFFVQSAQYKRRLLIGSTILFFAGVFAAAYTIG